MKNDHISFLLKNPSVQEGQFYTNQKDYLVSMSQILSVNNEVWLNLIHDGKVQAEHVIGTIFLYFKVQDSINPSPASYSFLN